MSPEIYCNGIMKGVLYEASEILPIIFWKRVLSIQNGFLSIKSAAIPGVKTPHILSHGTYIVPISGSVANVVDNAVLI